MSVLIDSYSETNQSGGEALGVAGSFAVANGQSFTDPDGHVLDSCQFNLRKMGSPTGNAVAKVYAHTGTWGSSGVPSGAALAVSDAVAVSTLGTSYRLVTFEFSGANRITLAAGTHYVVTVEYSAGTAGNYIIVGYDSSSPTHPGNKCYSNNGTSWMEVGGYDVPFYVYGAGATAWTVTFADDAAVEEETPGLPQLRLVDLADDAGATEAAGILRRRGIDRADSAGATEAFSLVHRSSRLTLELADFAAVAEQWRGDSGAPAAIPPLFPVGPSGDRVLIHGWSTDILGPASGEQRIQRRSIPVHGVEFSWLDFEDGEAAIVAAVLYRSDSRWVVPWWPGSPRATAGAGIGDSRVYLPTGVWADSPWALWATEAAAGALWVVLWRDARTFEVAAYAGHGSDEAGEYLSLAAPLAAAWPAGETVVIPGFTGYLVGDSPRDRLNRLLKSGKVVLRSWGAL